MSLNSLDINSNIIQPKETSILPSLEKVPASWQGRAMQRLDNYEHQLEKFLPNYPLQTRLDDLGNQIEQKFAKLTQFNNWLNDNGQGNWTQQLTTMLMKLPVRAARNIGNMIYSIIKTAMQAAVHPAKTLLQLAKMVILLIDTLREPETWSRIGAGMMGTSLGQAAVLTNPFSFIGIGVGAAMLLGGLSVRALKDAIEAKNGTVAKENNLLIQLPEDLLTGFFAGLLMAAAEKIRQGRKAAAKQAALEGNYRVKDLQEATKFAEKYIKDNNLPRFTRIEFSQKGHPSGRIALIWEYDQLNLFESKCRDLLPNKNVKYAHIAVRLDNPSTAEIYFHRYDRGSPVGLVKNLQQVKLPSSYPASPVPIPLVSMEPSKAFLAKTNVLPILTIDVKDRLVV